jgi:hypothetical protein
MPINPNIALGVQPIQQPNMLAQYGQMMALKAAQQETEGYEGVKSALSGGMSATDPRILQYGKRGIEAFKAAGEGRVKQIEVAKKQNEVLGSIFGGVLQDPTTGPQAVSRLVEMGVMSNDQAQRVIEQAGNNPDAWRKLAKPYYEGAIDAEKRLTAETSIKTAQISSGPSYQQAALARERFNLEQQRERSIQDILSGGAPAAGSPATVNALAPQEGAPAPANALAPQPGMPSEVAQLDSQIGQLIRVGTPQALNAVNALVARRNILMPTQQLVQNAQGQYELVDPRAGVSTPVRGAGGQPLQGKVTPLPYESSYTREVGEAAGKGDVALVQNAQSAVGKLQDINQTLDQLKTSDAITGFGADVLKDVERFRAQFTKDAKAGKRAADTEILNAMLGSEVFGMIQSLGIGARGLDTPAEREYLREVMTGTVRMDKAALVRLTEIRKKVTERAIDEYNKKVDNGELNKYFETRGMTPRKIEKPVAPTAAAVDTIESLKEAGLWQFMSPEDQKLWQK